MAETQVLIVGAGPTGLVLALMPARHGVRVRIVDENDGPGLLSRAMVVHARTLEFYRQLGFADEVVAEGIKIEQFHMPRGAHVAASFVLGDIGAGLSRFPFSLCYPQDSHERLLNRHLEAAGGRGEWNTEFVGFTDDGNAVTATRRRGDSEETVSVDYLCGCDGAKSAVRQALKLEFTGRTYEQLFFVADVEASRDAATRPDSNNSVGEKDFCALFPIRTTEIRRLIGIMPSANATESPDFEFVRGRIESLVGITIGGVKWFSSYRVDHRVTDRFPVGRVFIAGDAGHVHSPAGGQGMNTGIGDAVNQGWKLAAFIQDLANASILDTYESERIEFARRLVAATDRAFQALVGGGIARQLLRKLILPHILPFAIRFRPVRRRIFLALSQTAIKYADSDLSRGEAGSVRGGERLPWVDRAADLADNFEALHTLDWQVHVYGTATDELRTALQKISVPLNEYSWTDATEHAGLQRDAAYLVRPDGHVALAHPTQDPAAIQAFVSRHGIKAK